MVKDMPYYQELTDFFIPTLKKFVYRINIKNKKKLDVESIIGYDIDSAIEKVAKLENYKDSVKKLKAIRDDLSTALTNLETEYENIFDEIVYEDNDNPAIQKARIYDASGLTEEESRLRVYEYMDFRNERQVDRVVRNIKDEANQAESRYLGKRLSEDDF